jgi:myo-inositol-1(or 4)-monophosphatase
MAADSPADVPDWLGACRRSVAAIRTMLDDRPTIAERVKETGTRGEGGDRTLLIDEAAEDVVFAELRQLHDAGARFTAVSEERGVVDFGSPATLVVIDPIDGSLNAKRGLPHFALSLAVADGLTMADVWFGFVQDFGPEEEWVAWRGQGAQLDGKPLDPTLVERRNRAGKLEVIGVESADPRWVVQSVEALEETTHRIRAIGAIAVSLCQVAAARFDGMASLKRCRAVDAAAAQLIVREAGGKVAFIAFDDPLAAPLDLEPRSPVIAARTAEGLADVAKVPVWP